MSAAAQMQPLVLEGEVVRLEPLALAHVDALALAGLAPELWRLQPKPISTVDEMRAYVQAALDEQARGVSLPFAIVERDSGQVIGSTRYMDIAPAHRRLEIGATWLHPGRQRSGANTDAKRLLLTHAFEVLGVQRVVFKTETLNRQSRAALARIGAVQEGVFRRHLLSDSGRARDMMYFAILDDEWPAVKLLLAALQTPRARQG